MNNKFQKINVSLLNLDILAFKGPKLFNSPTFVEYIILNRIRLNELISSRIEFGIMPDFVNITEIIYPGSAPHTDTLPTALNFYLDAAEDETIFWEQKNSSMISEHGGLRGYDINKLIKTESFIAKKDDCFMMNTSIIHSVNMNTVGSKRIILRFMWAKNSFEEILDSIKIPD
jgi:hypothetical protein